MHFYPKWRNIWTSHKPTHKFSKDNKFLNLPKFEKVKFQRFYEKENLILHSKTPLVDPIIIDKNNNNDDDNISLSGSECSCHTSPPSSPVIRQNEEKDKQSCSVRKQKNENVYYWKNGSFFH